MDLQNNTIYNTLKKGDITLHPKDASQDLPNRYLFDIVKDPDANYYWIQMNFLPATTASTAMLIHQQTLPTPDFNYRFNVSNRNQDRGPYVGELHYELELWLEESYGGRFHEDIVHQVTFKHLASGSEETITVDKSAYNSEKWIYEFSYAFPKVGKYGVTAVATFTDREGKLQRIEEEYQFPIEARPQLAKYLSSSYTINRSANGCIEGITTKTKYEILNKQGDWLWSYGEATFMRSAKKTRTAVSLQRKDIRDLYQRGYRQEPGIHEYEDYFPGTSIYNIGDSPYYIEIEVGPLPGNNAAFYNNKKAITITGIKQADLCHRRTNRWNQGGIDNIKVVNKTGDEVIAVILEREVHIKEAGDYRFTFSVYDGSAPKKKKVGDYEFTQTMQGGSNMMRLRIPKSEWPTDMKLALEIRKFKMHYPSGGVDGWPIIRPFNKPKARQEGGN